MQYSKGLAMPIAGRGTGGKVPRFASWILVAMLALGAGGCADSVASKGPIGRFSDLVKGYDKTLTKEQQAAAIAELQSEAKHQEGAAPQDGTAAVTKPEPAAN
jgi:uncharacterized protein HemX